MDKRCEDCWTRDAIAVFELDGLHSALCSSCAGARGLVERESVEDLLARVEALLAS